MSSFHRANKSKAAVVNPYGPKRKSSTKPNSGTGLVTATGACAPGFNLPESALAAAEAPPPPPPSPPRPRTLAVPTLANAPPAAELAAEREAERAAEREAGELAEFGHLLDPSPPAEIAALINGNDDCTFPWMTDEAKMHIRSSLMSNATFNSRKSGTSMHNGLVHCRHVAFPPFSQLTPAFFAPPDSMAMFIRQVAAALNTAPLEKGHGEDLSTRWTGSRAGEWLDTKAVTDKLRQVVRSSLQGLHRSPQPLLATEGP